MIAIIVFAISAYSINFFLGKTYSNHDAASNIDIDCDLKDVNSACKIVQDSGQVSPHEGPLGLDKVSTSKQIDTSSLAKPSELITPKSNNEKRRSVVPISNGQTDTIQIRQ